MKVAVLLFPALIANATPASAHHPGDRIDEVMAEKEPAFEPTDQWWPPDAELVTASGTPLDVSEHVEQIVVLSFVTEGCGETCDAQQALLAQVQGSVNITPMREMVRFITIAEPGTAIPGWDPINWIQTSPTDDTRVGQIAGDFASLSVRAEDTPMVHLIDRGGRHTGIFHGSDFGHVNMVLYINGLSNERPLKPGLLDRFWGIFR